ncbi:hypothetical protein ABMA57_07560 [Saccharospirillum sp. HFRX-1]|uniref:hypothetical protein n=1 Tax=unclassified Saccharospirillum TaxID=2633430 RepID=UPI0037157C32
MSQLMVPPPKPAVITRHPAAYGGGGFGAGVFSFCQFGRMIVIQYSGHSDMGFSLSTLKASGIIPVGMRPEAETIAGMFSIEHFGQTYDNKRVVCTIYPNGDIRLNIYREEDFRESDMDGVDMPAFSFSYLAAS